MRAQHATWTILEDDHMRVYPLVIRDDNGPRSITNDAEHVVEQLVKDGKLPAKRRLFYYDSTGQLDEIRVEDGKFVGFAPGPRQGGARQ